MATAATASNQVQGTIREAKGKNEARRVRKSGKVPATLYGADKPPVSISVEGASSKCQVGDVEAAVGVDTVLFVKLAGKFAVVAEQIADTVALALHLDLKRIDILDLQTAAAPEDPRVRRRPVHHGLPFLF